jgi:hypothetical protein
VCPHSLALFSHLILCVLIFVPAQHVDSSCEVQEEQAADTQRLEVSCQFRHLNENAQPHPCLFTFKSLRPILHVLLLKLLLSPALLLSQLLLALLLKVFIVMVLLLFAAFVAAGINLSVCQQACLQRHAQKHLRVRFDREDEKH